MNKDCILGALFVVFLFSLVFISNNILVIIIFLIGVILGVLTALKYDRDKVGGLVVLALAIIIISAIIFGLMVGQGPRHIETDLLTPYQLSIYQKLSTISAILFGFIVGSTTIVAIKTHINKGKYNQNVHGSLICQECGEYYKLQPGELPEDFDKCQCGGELEYKEDM